MSWTPPAAPTEPSTLWPNLEILDSGGAVLYAAPLYQRREGTAELNRQPIQAEGSDTQGVAGDGRTIVGTRTYFIRVEGDIRVEKALIITALRDCATLRLDLVTQPQAGGIRIASEEPIGRGSNVWRFGLEFAASTIDSTDGITGGADLY